jgi:hypothetical protein
MKLELKSGATEGGKKKWRKIGEYRNQGRFPTFHLIFALIQNYLIVKKN